MAVSPFFVVQTMTDDVVEVIVAPPTIVQVISALREVVEVATGVQAPAAVIEREREVVEVNIGQTGPRGPEGPEGPPGPAGPPGEAVSLRFDIETPSGAWIIAHNLGRAPSAQVFLASGELVVADVLSDPANLFVSFAEPQAGYVILF